MTLGGLDRLLASRLGFGLADSGTASPGRWSREACATAFFYLFFVGPTVALVSLLAPGGEGRSEVGVLFAIVGAYGVAVVVIVAYARLPFWFFHVVLASASVLLSVAFYHAGESRPAFALFYAWIALYAGLFFRPRGAAVQIAIASGALGVTYALESSPLGFEYGVLFVPLLTTPVGIVLFLMHRQQRVAAALEVSEERLRRSQQLESIGRLAGGVAHDFNNLLTVILGYARTLERRRPDPVDQFEAQEIIRAGERAAALTAQLLAFGRRQVLRPTALDVNDVVRGVEPFLGRMIGAHVDLRLDLDPEVATVTADPAQLEQVLINLVTNASDAMPGGGSVTIATANAELGADEVPGAPPGSYVLISVTDLGSGIAPELLQHLFEPFFTTKDLGAGSGLGLASVHGTVTQSGGFIDVSSEVGEGTTFSVYLPPAGRAAETPREAPGVAPAAGVGGSETILLVEDEPAVRELARTVLSEAGYRVLAAAGAVEALALARELDGRVDLLVSDVVMPEVSGAELSERLVAEHGPVPALFVSGYASRALADELLERGSALIPKPFSPEVLLAAVRDLLAGPNRGRYAAAGRSVRR